MGRAVGCLVLAGGLAMALITAPAMAEESVQAPGDARPSLMLPIEQDELALAEPEPEPLRLSMEFQDANLRDVLKIFSEQTGINVIATTGVGNTPITLYLREVRVLDALDQILTAANMTYERAQDSDIYVVKPKSRDPSRAITRVYRLKYARVSESVLAMAATAFAARTPFEATLSAGSFGSAGDITAPQASSGGGSEGASGGGSSSGSGRAQMSGASGKGIDTVLKNLLTGEGKLVVDSRTNSLIITDVPENFPRIEAALVALDVRTKQILVDAEIVETSLNKLKDLGFEWGSGTEGEMLVLTPGLLSTTFPQKFVRGRNNALTTPVEVDGVFDGDFTAPGQMSIGRLDFSSINGVLQALQTDTNTKILARPKVLTLDNESAIIRLTSDETVGFTSDSQPGSDVLSSTPERTMTGVVLVVTPQINEDGYITMVVEPMVTKTVASKVSAPAGGADTRDPKTRSSRSLVRVRSGDTLVVAGLIDRSDEETMRRVPVLSGIPLLGEAFKNSETNKSTSELIVFVTPRVLDEGQATTMASAGPSVGARAQEATGGTQDLIEETLNRLESAK